MAKLQTPLSGHHALEKGKYAEIRKFINQWLLDQSVYCNNCGFPFFVGEKECCENPQIGKNIQHCQALFLQIQAQRKTNLNEFGSNDGKTMRMGVSLPPDLMVKLEQFCKEKWGEKLFVNQKDFRGFMKAFPQFTTCERI
jgi:hypothetical protein